MVVAHEVETGGHCRAGYAAVGHTARKGADRHTNRGLRFVAALRYGTDGVKFIRMGRRRGLRR